MQSAHLVVSPGPGAVLPAALIQCALFMASTHSSACLKELWAWSEQDMLSVVVTTRTSSPCFHSGGLAPSSFLSVSLICHHLSFGETVTQAQA